MKFKKEMKIMKNRGKEENDKLIDISKEVIIMENSVKNNTLYKI